MAGELLWEALPGMKIALICFDFGEYSVRLASSLGPEAEVLLFLPRSKAEPYTHLLSSSVRLQVLEEPRLRHVFRQIRLVMRIVKQIRAFRPDVVHLQEGHMWLNWVLPFLGNCPLVVTAHDAMLHPGDTEARKTPQWLRDRGLSRAKQLIVHAPQIKELLVKRLSIPSSAVHVIPHILIGEAVEEQAQPNEQFILFFGRIWEYKGLDYLIRAEPLVTAKFPNAKIVIAGKGEDFSRYSRMMTHPESFVVYNEYISDEKRAELFSLASIVVLPYIEASQSGVIPIAYRFAKPVIATNVGGLPDMVEHGRTGYLVPPRDETALAEAIIDLLQNDELRQKMGENGREKVNTACAPELVGKLTYGVYRQAIHSAQ